MLYNLKNLVKYIKKLKTKNKIISILPEQFFPLAELCVKPPEKKQRCIKVSALPVASNV